MSKLKYLIITILLSLIILPTLWATARGSLFKVSSQTNKGLVGHWALDNVTGAQDKTPYGNNGTGAGGVTIGGATDQHGQAGRATTFVGASSQNITASVVNMSANQPKSFAVWVKTATGNRAIVRAATTTSPIYVYIETNGNLSSWMNNTGYTFGGTLTDNAWHYVVWVYSGTQELGYIDGVQVGSANTDTVSALSDTIVFGSTANFFNGSMADVRLYNRALSSTEVTSLYNSYRPKQAIFSLQKGLVGQWDLAQKSLKTSTTIADLTPYGNIGTFVNSPSFTTDRHGQSNNALSFSQASTRINNGTGVWQPGTSDFSISVWAKWTDNTNNQNFFVWGSSGDNIYGRVINGGGVQFVGYDSVNGIAWNAAYATGFADGNWHHLVFMLDAATRADIYIDGVSRVNDSTVNADALNPPDFLIGGTGAGASTITMSDFRVYNRLLSSTEITSLYNSYRPVRQISSLYKGLVLDMPLAQTDLIGTNRIADKTPYSNTGTLVGSPTFTTDRHDQSNKAMALNGSSQYVLNSTADFRSSDSQGTVSAWIKLGTLGAHQIILASNDNTGTLYNTVFYVRNTNLLSVSQRADDTADLLSGSTALTTGVWYYVTLVSNGTSYSLYVNGQAETLSVVSGSNTGDWFADTSGRDNFAIGVQNQLTINSYFNGSIANVKVWNRALSSAEITALYQSYK